MRSPDAGGGLLRDRDRHVIGRAFDTMMFWFGLPMATFYVFVGLVSIAYGNNTHERLLGLVTVSLGVLLARAWRKVKRER